MAEILLRQDLEGGGDGYLKRADVVRGIAEARHRLERDHDPQFLLPPVDPSVLLWDICQSIGLEPLEMVEAVGFQIFHERLYRAIVPGHAPLKEYDQWMEKHKDAEFVIGVQDA